MKFNEIFKNLNVRNNYEKELLFDLIFSTSNKVKSNIDFLSYRNDFIDFDFTILLNKFNHYKDSEMPIEYIFNKVNFCNKDFYIEKGVFIPRKETEHMIWDFVNRYKDFKFNSILDLCSGSGIISCILKLWFPTSKIKGVEKSLKAISVSEINKRLHNLDINFINRDIFLELNEFSIKDVDFVFFNPPYISKCEKLDRSLSYEPDEALFADNNGIFYYEKFFNEYFSFFKKNTLFLIEFGHNQKQILKKILEKNNIINFEFIDDVFAKNRFLLINFQKWS